jgi:hypothetical protein
VIELDLALGFAKTLGTVVGAIGMVALVTWACWDTTKGRRK